MILHHVAQEKMMVKPIGNLIANLRTQDKVGFKTLAKFSGQAPLPGKEPTSPPAAGKKPAKYKKRKK